MQARVVRFRSVVGAIVAGAAFAAAPLDGQQPAPRAAIVHVQVADTAGSPLPGVTLTILRTRQQEALFVGTSDNAGKHTFSFTPESVNYQIVVRKVGYIQTARLVPVRPGDTLALTLRMARLPPQLDTVKVTERQLPSKRYFLGSAEIMASDKPIDDAYDAIRELSPVMVMGDGARLCRGVSSVWINGQRWTNTPPPDPGVTVDHTPAGSMRPPPRALPPAFRMAPPPSPMALGTRSVMGLLMAINKEHIEQMRYVNCWDTSMPGIGGMDAVFVVLKPGISFNLQRGSYVDSTATPPP